MSHLRKDPIVNRWVIIAANRAERPGAFISSQQRDEDGTCPFCEGHEADTPGELLAYRAPGTPPDKPGWRVRVVHNKFPALDRIPGTCAADGAPDSRPPGLFQTVPAIGSHEVVVESPRHLLSTSDLSPEQLAEVFRAYRRRLIDLRRDPRMIQPIIFKNVGEAAGASMAHTHSQLMVLPMVPAVMQEELDGAWDFFDRNGPCVYCEMVRQELQAGQRVVIETPGCIAFCPFASRFAYETWVLPRSHASHFEATDDSGLAELAVVMKRLVTKIEAALDRPAYNYLVHTAPFDRPDLEHYHWHIEVVPAVTKPAGFELGSGYYVNPVSPEDAARALRGAE
jgi:UDPglucose--hexose-1-phosphate uridylyltransferase